MEEKFNKEQDTIKDKINFYKNIAWTFLIIGLILLIFSSTIFLIRNTNIFHVKLSKYAALGNFFSGTITSLWSLAGVLFIYVAFLGQRHELLFQREELKLNREELKGQREQLELTRIELKGQTKQFELQTQKLDLEQFETTFFNMITLHHQIISNISYSNFSGREAVKNIKHKFINNSDFRKLCSSKKNDKDKIFNNRDYNVLSSFKNELGYYYRNFFKIISLIDETKNINKNKYIQILKSQLNNDELWLIFFYCLSNADVDKFKNYIEKYNIIEHIIDDEYTQIFIDDYKIKMTSDNIPSS